ncbi:MAG: hypothetical protein IPH05_12720, partial [Flavobacteriales bacterium]|nr:hypothetical protein [Flavobacteriales bacterium]
MLISFTAPSGERVLRYRYANNALVTLSGDHPVRPAGNGAAARVTYNPNNTTLNATYTPTAAEIAAGTLTLTLTSTGNGNCLPVASNKVITFTPAPTVSAGPNGSVCANNSARLSWPVPSPERQVRCGAVAREPTRRT